MSDIQPSMNYGLPACRRYITGHDQSTGSSIFLPVPNLLYRERVSYAVARAYTLPAVPAPLGDNTDLQRYLSPAEEEGDSTASCSVEGKSVTIDNGVNMVCMTMGPGSQSPMHRTVSVDLIIVTEGEIELELDSGEKKILRRGDTLVQRGTMHRWRNPSMTESTRIIAVLIASEKFSIAGQEIKQEYLH